MLYTTIQSSSDYFPPNLQTIITALMLSTGGHGDQVLETLCIFLNLLGILIVNMLSNFS